MTYPAHSARPIVLKARRDTILLVAAASAMTFALAHMVESHRVPLASEDARQAWTGGLAELAAMNAQPASIEPLTSASLVVPQSDLALPQPSVRALVKLRGCGGHACLPKAGTAPEPAPRPGSDNVSIVERHRPAQHRTKPSLMSRLNPLNHLPDASSIKRPFVLASDTVSGWFRRF